MTPDRAFTFAGNLAVFGWLLLAASLFVPTAWRDRLRLLGGRVVPALLAAGYVAALLFWWGDARGQGGFGSLAEVGALFSVPGLLLAGWVHYLAFDLLIGRWEIDDSGGEAAAWWLLPCLVLTFLFGPAGWLLYLLARTAMRARSPQKGDGSP